MSISRIGLGGLAVMFSLSSAASAAVVEIHVGGYYFTPQFPEVQAGDTIRWIRDGGTHDVTSGVPCQDDSGLFYSPLTASYPVYEWTVPGSFDGSVIPYYCSVGNHCVASNQFGALLVNVEAHYLSTNGFSFVPETVFVNAGDAIFWIHAGGSHTVTSGSGCSPDGRFDEVLDNFNPMPFHVVPADEPSGVIDYYCIPHCVSDMTGQIDVTGLASGCAEDLNGDGSVTVDDLLQLLAVYGASCTCPEDIDGNGVVSVDDLLLLLSAYGGDC